MRIQATRIEQLDVKHPGLRLDVDLMFDKYAALPSIAAMIKEKTGEALPIRTISNYKQKRWLISKLRLKELKESFRAVKDELGENAISEATQARLLELIDHAMTAGAALDPHFLLREQRLWAVHTANLEKIETEKKKLEMQLGVADQEKRKVAGLVLDAAAAEKEGKPFDHAAALRQISAVIGVGGTLEERVEK